MHSLTDQLSNGICCPATWLSLAAGLPLQAFAEKRLLQELQKLQLVGCMLGCGPQLTCSSPDRTFVCRCLCLKRNACIYMGIFEQSGAF